jgi:hypothetical protein
MPIVEIGSNEVLHIGLQCAGFPIHRQVSATTSLRRFQGHYGLLPISCCSIFRDIQNVELVGTSRIEQPKLVDLLMTMRWFKTYGIEEELAGVFHICERTFRDRTWPFVVAIQALKASKVSQLCFPLLFLVRNTS